MDTDDLLRALLVLVAIVLIAPLVGMAVFVPAVFGTGVGGMPGHGGAGVWWLLSGLVPLVLVVGAGYLLYSALGSDRDRTDPAIEELRAAYARGDLTDEEFDARYERLRRADGRDEDG